MTLTRTGRRLALAGTALVLAAGSAGAAVTSAAAATTHAAASSSCTGQKATGPFRINPDNHSQVIGAANKPFISYGISVPGLVDPNWEATQGRDPDKIKATAENWCGNTVRLQISQYNLLGPSGTSFSQKYLAAVESEVSLAEHYHLVVVLNDSTESPPGSVKSGLLGPTTMTETFWKDMTKVYGRNPQVIFDLFNEPRIPLGDSVSQDWQQWRNGVSPYLGMENLARYVRAQGAQNVYWAQGPAYSISFQGMERSGGLLTGVGPVVYAVHHPSGLYIRLYRPEYKLFWFLDFGYLVNLHIAPVVEGEWTNYEPHPTSNVKPIPTSCWPDAPEAIVDYLAYLHAHGVGMSAYQLQPGLLIKSYPHYAVPTTINAATWSCESATESQPGQGAGTLIMNWFRKYNG
ncbi:MAG: cellulase family glycosylhydrolase [Streptosporangiaceae bacterium]